MYFVWKALADFIQAKIPVGVLTFLMVGFLLVLQPLHYALAEGVFPYFHAGYCTRDVGCPASQAIATRLDESDLRALRGQLRENFRLKCDADNVREEDRYQEYIDQDQITYRELNDGKGYDLPPVCPS